MSCPEGMPLDAQLDPYRASMAQTLGAMGVQCPFFRDTDGVQVCGLAWGLYAHLAKEMGTNTLLPGAVEAAHAVVDGALGVDELPLGGITTPEEAVALWGSALRLAAERYAEQHG